MSTTTFININTEALDQAIKEQIKDKINDIDTSVIFYSFEDILNLTGFSKGYFDKHVLYDPRFKECRKKIGRKWVFDAEKTRSFLLMWLEEKESDE